MRNIAYWITTGLVVAVFFSGGAFELKKIPDVTRGMALLGYPLYVVTLLGVWKILGAIAILLPRTATLKEWAYAGMFFDLTGASFSHYSVHDSQWHIVTPLIILLVVVLSWALRPKSRKCH